MSVNTAIVIATFILATTAIIVSVMIASRKRQAKEEDLARLAAARGWKFDGRSHRGYRVHTWSGTTDGVSWSAESLDFVSRNSKQNRPDIARWHGEWNAGIKTPIVCMGVPEGKELHTTQMTPNDSFLGKLAQKAVGFAFDKAIDLYFGDLLGEEVDAGAMHRVETKLPGFIVMAASKDEGARLMAHGFEQSLTSATHDPSSLFSKDDRPWILLRSKGVSIARIGKFRDLDEIDSFTRAGVALTRSSKFGRPFA